MQEEDVYSADMNVSAEQRFEFNKVATDSSPPRKKAPDPNRAAVPLPSPNICSNADAVPEETTLMKNMVHDGHLFTTQKRTKSGTRMTCAYRRSEKDCNAAINVHNDGSSIKMTGSHGKGCGRKNGLRVEDNEDSFCEDCYDSMYQWVEERSVA